MSPKNKLRKPNDEEEEANDSFSDSESSNCDDEAYTGNEVFAHYTRK